MSKTIQIECEECDETIEVAETAFQYGRPVAYCAKHRPIKN